MVLLFVFAAIQVKCERVYNPGRRVPRSVKRPMHSPNQVFFYKVISIRPSSNIYQLTGNLHIDHYQGAEAAH